jgi:hypothetical protein
MRTRDMAKTPVSRNSLSACPGLPPPPAPQPWQRKFDFAFSSLARLSYKSGRRLASARTNTRRDRKYGAEVELQDNEEPLLAYRGNPVPDI